jgi:hypothetical protein
MISNVLITLSGGTQIRPDAAVNVVPEIQAEVTTHPVETGASISDHAIAKPRGYRLDLVFTPSRDETITPSGPDRPGVVWRLLRIAALNGDRITLLVDADLIETAVIESISMPRNVAAGDSLHLSMIVREIVMVEAVTLTPAPRPVASGTKQRNRITLRGVVQSLPAPVYLEALGLAAAGNYAAAIGVAGAASIPGMSRAVTAAVQGDWPPAYIAKAISALGL